MQKVVTLNTSCDIACLTFQLPHVTTGSFLEPPTTTHNWLFLELPLADYPLGRIGSCLRPGMVRGPGPFILIFLYLINNLVSDFVTQLVPQPSDQPASQLFKSSQNTNQ